MENKCQDVPKLEPLYTADGYVKWCYYNKKKILAALQKLNIKLPQDSKIPVLGLSLRGLKTSIPTNTCAQVFIAALFTIAKKWKQSKSSSTDKWINKMLYIHTMEYY